ADRARAHRRSPALEVALGGLSKRRTEIEVRDAVPVRLRLACRRRRAAPEWSLESSGASTQNDPLSRRASVRAARAEDPRGWVCTADGSCARTGDVLATRLHGDASLRRTHGPNADRA